MTREEAIAAIATALHSYDHPAYDTVSYCAFCHAIAVQMMEQLPDEDEVG